MKNTVYLTLEVPCTGPFVNYDYIGGPLQCPSVYTMLATFAIPPYK